jgi:hypothetical protein
LVINDSKGIIHSVDIVSVGGCSCGYQADSGYEVQCLVDFDFGGSGSDGYNPNRGIRQTYYGQGLAFVTGGYGVDWDSYFGVFHNRNFYDPQNSELHLPNGAPETNIRRTNHQYRDSHRGT